MKSGIQAEAQKRGITRLCHFTPSRNLAQILAGDTGILATKNLQASERAVYTPTDLARLDGLLDHICCSIEYPNAWYFEKARSKEVLFKDWVIIFISPKYLWSTDAKFCPRNAAAAGGMYIEAGEVAFNNMFDNTISGAYGKTYSRTAKTLPFCATDEQAEVLIPDTVSLSDILGFAVQNEAQACNEIVRLKLLRIPRAVVENLRIVIAPALFDKYTLSASLKSGVRPSEQLFVDEKIG
jgi:hypothetical protein